METVDERAAGAKMSTGSDTRGEANTRAAMMEKADG